ncbi:hypothetical protein BS47DRAFT_183084 [Hydnum rufescens UP504]|uniref:Uncharacterized protein n=1 Tax=Hydnum rufescens UP504 TaxID=1448309 RepID=A0A9P6ANK7_9AGAM|nr:hypothetical protein BS47DRAFT_183084 [Hydnum rufescens UP504]
MHETPPNKNTANLQDEKEMCAATRNPKNTLFPASPDQNRRGLAGTTTLLLQLVVFVPGRPHLSPCSLQGLPCTRILYIVKPTSTHPQGKDRIKTASAADSKNALI